MKISAQDMALSPLLSYAAQAAYAQQLSDLRDGFFASVGLLTLGLPEAGGHSTLPKDVLDGMADIRKSRLKAQASWRLPVPGLDGLVAQADLSSPRVLSLSVSAQPQVFDKLSVGSCNDLAITLAADLSRFVDDLAEPTFQTFSSPEPEEDAAVSRLIEQRVRLRLWWAEDEAQFESGVRATASFLMLLAKYSCGQLEVLI